jgi:hypothetical protein
MLRRSLTQKQKEISALCLELHNAVNGRYHKIPTMEPPNPEKRTKPLTKAQTLRAAELLDDNEAKNTHLTNAVLWNFLVECVPEAVEEDAAINSDNPARYVIEWTPSEKTLQEEKRQAHKKMAEALNKKSSENENPTPDENEEPQWECTVCGNVGTGPCHGKGARKPLNATARREHIAELDAMRERNCPRISLELPNPKN